MSNSVDLFVQRLAALSCSADAILNDHLAYYDELLPHVLMGDLTRHVLANAPHESQLVQFIEDALNGNDKAVRDLIAVSFVENIETEEQLESVLEGIDGDAVRQEWQRQHEVK